MDTILSEEFFGQDALYVAPRLLGKTLVRKVNNNYIRCKIVEVEAYMGSLDKASHAYNNKRTNRTESLFLTGGHTYVYLIYGMHYCLNIVTYKEGIPQCVLIRAAEPLDNESISIIKDYRKIKSKKIEDLTNGPGKLSQALNINKDLDKYNITKKGSLYIENTKPNKDFSIISSPRINIPYAEEYISVPWRYYIYENPFVSVKDDNGIFYNL